MVRANREHGSIGILLGVVVVALWSACDADVDVQGAEWLARSPREDVETFPQASIQGPLLREGHCLYVGGGPQRRFLAFPKPSTYAWFDEASETLHVGGSQASVGEMVQIGGGGSGARFGDDWAVPPDPSCDLGSVWNVGAMGPPLGAPLPD